MKMGNRHKTTDNSTGKPPMQYTGRGQDVHVAKDTENDPKMAVWRPESLKSQM